MNNIYIIAIVSVLLFCTFVLGGFVSSVSHPYAALLSNWVAIISAVVGGGLPAVLLGGQ